MAVSGTALLDFGAFPGATDATVVITGQSAILSGSLVECWIFPAATTDHSADEHVVETIKVFAGNVVAGTGFTIYGLIDDQEPEVVPFNNRGRLTQDPAGAVQSMLYGKWNIAWVWN